MGKKLLLIVVSMSSFLSASRIHVVGDSHAFYCFAYEGILDWRFSHYYAYKNANSMAFDIHWLGPTTMHRVGRDGFNALNLRDLGIQDGDTVIFVFGEIDVRCHIGKQRDLQKVPLASILQPLADNYLKTVLNNKQNYNYITCVIANVVPPMNGDFSKEYPSYGSISDRILITQQLNSLLKTNCSQHGIKFLDFYQFYATQAGDLDKTLSDGNVHINLAYNYCIKQQLAKVLVN